jgi:hypothetical protein
VTASPDHTPLHGRRVTSGSAAAWVGARVLHESACSDAACIERDHQSADLELSGDLSLARAVLAGAMPGLPGMDEPHTAEIRAYNAGIREGRASELERIRQHFAGLPDNTGRPLWALSQIDLLAGDTP